MLVTTTLLPHEKAFWNSHMQVASPDHGMWFHRDFHIDDWLVASRLRKG